MLNLNPGSVVPQTPAGTLDASAYSSGLGARQYKMIRDPQMRVKSLLQDARSQHQDESDTVGALSAAADLQREIEQLQQMGGNIDMIRERLNAPVPMMPTSVQPNAGEVGAGLIAAFSGGGAANAANMTARTALQRQGTEYQNQMQTWDQGRDMAKLDYDQAIRDKNAQQGRVWDLQDAEATNAQNRIKETQKRKDSLQATADDLLSAMAVAKDPESLKLLAGRYNEIAQELGKADADITGLSESIKRRDTEAKANRDVDNYRQAFSTFTVYGGASPEQIAAMEAERQRIKETYGIEVPPVSDQRTVGERKMENAPIEARRKQRETLLQRLRGALAKMQTFEQGSPRYIGAAAEANAIKAQIDALDNSPDETGGEVAPMNPLQGPIGIRPEGGNPYGSNMAPTKTGRKSSGGGGSKGGGGSGGGYSGLSSKQVAQKRNYYIAAKAKADAADLEIASILAKGMGANADDLKRLTAARNSKRQAESRLKELNTEMKARKPQPKKQPSKPSGKSGKTDGYSWKVVG